MNKTLCLNMIVKNESHIILKTLTQLVEKINFDYWVICDTGSTDSTPDIIKQFFTNINIPGELLHHSWKDFSHNRNLALNAAFNKTDYLLVFDADDEIIGNIDIPKFMDLDSYFLEFGGECSYKREAIVNNRKKWKYVGVLHEILKSCEPVGPPGHITGNYHLISGRTGSRNNDPDKYKKDAEVLVKAYNEAGPEVELWLKQRYAFYCANSFRDAKMWDKAIEWYKLRITLGGWVQELYISHKYIGDILFNMPPEEGVDKKDTAVQHWLCACEYNANRYETLAIAAKYFISKNQDFLAKLLYDQVNIDYLVTDPNCLFMDIRLHNYGLLCDMIMFYANKNDFIKSVSLHNILLKRVNLIDDKNLWSGILYNCFYLSNKTVVSSEFDELSLKLADNIQNSDIQFNMLPNIYEHFTNKAAKHLTAHHNSLLSYTKKLPVVITITSCKRINLLIKTLNSIRSCFNDLEHVIKIICIDDNSSIDDRETMKYLYPWVTFIMKTEEQKGHRVSMEIIREQLKCLNAKYWVQLEDDWTFVRKDNYITRGIKLLEDYRAFGIRQILFNKGYSEIAKDISWPCGKKLEDGLLIHVHGRQDHPCGYWPHFSFRPSIISVDAIEQLGSFNSPNTFFERDYAIKYIEAGFKSAYFDRISCLHTGPLAGQRAVGNNAYDLNNMIQGIDRGVQNAKEPEPPESSKLHIKVINLDHRKDRLDSIDKQLTASNCEYQRISAINGKNILPNDPRLKIFMGNDFSSSPGVIGCALTHIELWKQLLEDDTTDYYIILEDDAKLLPQWKNYTLNILDKIKSEDLIFFSYHTRNPRYIGLNKSEKGHLDILDRDIYIGSTSHYSINKNGAKKALDLIKKRGCLHGIDYMIVKTPLSENINIKEHIPQLSSSGWFGASNTIDSDIEAERRGITQDELPIIYDNYIRVGIVSNFSHSEQLCHQFGLLAKDNGMWDNIKLVSEPPYEYLIIINYPVKEFSNDYIFQIPLSKMLVFQCEPWCEGKSWGANTWGELDYTRVKEKCLCVRSRKDNDMTQAWSELGLNYKQFIYPNNWTNKNKLISTVVSNRYTDPGHIKRIDFLKYFDYVSSKDKNSVSIDIYSKNNDFSFNNYIEKNLIHHSSPLCNKYEGLINYKYYFAVENNFELGYITEKFWEPILCECLVFYQGAPDIDKYIDSEAFVKIDLDDIEGVYKLIQKAIKEDWWSKRIKAIRAAKDKILNEYNMLSIVSSKINANIN